MGWGQGGGSSNGVRSKRLRQLRLRLWGEAAAAAEAAAEAVGNAQATEQGGGREREAARTGGKLRAVWKGEAIWTANAGGEMKRRRAHP